MKVMLFCFFFVIFSNKFIHAFPVGGYHQLNLAEENTMNYIINLTKFSIQYIKDKRLAISTRTTKPPPRINPPKFFQDLSAIIVDGSNTDDFPLDFDYDAEEPRFDYQIVKILRASIQVVRGFKHRITFEMIDASCSECPSELCQVEIKETMWLDVQEVLKYQCFE
jgi:hypothetical protein